jgi:hypothetical protein
MEDFSDAFALASMRGVDLLNEEDPRHAFFDKTLTYLTRSIIEPEAYGFTPEINLRDYEEEDK